jgi:hypothetical protein
VSASFANGQNFREVLVAELMPKRLELLWRAVTHSLYRARTRTQPLAGEAETGAARPTATQNHRPRARAPYPVVVPTFGGQPEQSQTLRSLKVLESAKLG